MMLSDYIEANLLLIIRFKLTFKKCWHNIAAINENVPSPLHFSRFNPSESQIFVDASPIERT